MTEEEFAAFERDTGYRSARPRIVDRSGRKRLPVVGVTFAEAEPTANGPEAGFHRPRSGRRPRGAPTAAATPGGTCSRPAGATAPRIAPRIALASVHRLTLIREALARSGSSTASATPAILSMVAGGA